CSKQSDIKRRLYDANTHIDSPFLKSLIEESTDCFYCKVPMQFIEYCDSLCTIERKDNSLGHSKANCVLACRKCNYSRVGQFNPTQHRIYKMKHEVTRSLERLNADNLRVEEIKRYFEQQKY